MTYLAFYTMQQEPHTQVATPSYLQEHNGFDWLADREGDYLITQI